MTLLEQTLTEPPVLRTLEHIDGFVKGRISIILPAFNEEDNISRTIVKVNEQFEAICPDYEIIVVDDGSHDETWTTVENLRQKNVQLIGYPRNQGKGYALKKGLYHATGELAFTIDSDMEVWPRELRTYLTALESADIVIGSKRHPLSRVQTPAIRRFLSLGFNMLERLLTGVKASDTQAGVKAARSKALYKILPLLAVKRYAFDAELLAVASLVGLRIKELPVDIELKASFSPTQVMRMLLDLLGIAYRLRIKRWYQRNYVVTAHTYKPLLSFERHNGPF
jgi:glycosyltransferase involved in cell wall biosynthesis